MVSVSAVKNVAKSVTKAFGSNAAKASASKSSASIFSSMSGSVTKTREISADSGSFKEFWEYTKRYFSTAKIGLKKADVRKMEALDMPKFWQEAEIVLCKKIGIPQDFAPMAYSVPQLENPRFYACFDWATYNIMFNGAKAANFKKNMLFSLMAHELQHAKQYLTILRSSKVAPEAIEYISGSYAAAITDKAIDNYKYLPLEYWVKRAKENSYEFDIVQLAKDIKKATSEELLKIKNKMFAEVLEERCSVLEKFRKQVVEKMGPLPENMNCRAVQYFSDFKRSIESAGKGIQYYMNAVEGEAFMRQIGAAFSYLFHKFI